MSVKKRETPVNPAVYPAGLAVLFLIILSVKKDLQASEAVLGDVIKQEMAQEFSDKITEQFVPVLSYARGGEQEENWLLEQQFSGILPLYGYYREVQGQTMPEDEEDGNSLSLEEILLAEAQEGSFETEGADGEDPVQSQESTDELQALLIAENEAAIHNMTDTAAEEQAQAYSVQPREFIRHELQNPVDLQVLADYETLVKNFYAIDKNTMAGSDQLNAAKLLDKDLTISKEGEGPQILIYHTHSQEGFSDSVPGDEGTSIVGAGEHLSEILEEEYGYEVLHHKGRYDVETRDDAYANALPDIEKVLSENPSIQVVIDLHRDEMPEETKLLMDLDGRPTARFMFFNGLSRTNKTGNIAYLYNENQEDNLAFSFQLQLAATEYYPGLTRKIYLKGYRYNMHLKPRTTLIELGAQNNTVEEAMNACDPLAHIIHMVLSGEE